MATRPRPSGVAVALVSARNSHRQRRLTERNRASDLAREISVIIPRRSRVRKKHRSEECVHTEGLHFKHLIRLLHDLSQPYRLLQFSLPLQPRLGGLGKQGVEAPQSTVVVNRTGVYRSTIIYGVWTCARSRGAGVLVLTICLPSTTEW